MASPEAATHTSASETATTSADNRTASAVVFIDFFAADDAVAAVGAYKNFLDVVVSVVACEQ